MTEVFFYHLERLPLEAVLPAMLAKTLERQWRAVVQAGSEERAEALANHLWTNADDSFIPHGSKSDGYAALQPIWLTAIDENPNGATVRFYVDGAAAGDVGSLERAVIIFDGRDSDAVTRARDDWKRFKSDGFQVSYWQQNAQGRWENKA